MRGCIPSFMKKVEIRFLNYFLIRKLSSHKSPVQSSRFLSPLERIGEAAFLSP
jgi:hypothetical protein